MHILVFTGGPCGGKTTALNVIAEWLRNNDFAVLAVPEIATEVLNAGVSEHRNDVSWLDFQEHLIKLQIAKEDQYASLLSRFRKSRKVLLCDRGAMDCRAYMNDDQFLAVLKRLGCTIPDLRDKRYDAVFHLVTAADGAEEFYTLENNKARIERTIEEACNIDRRTQDVWVGQNHPLMIIDNSTDFEHKLKRLWTGVCRVVGIPEPIEEERRFLIKHPDFKKGDMSISTIVAVSIEQAYLQTFSPSMECRIRKRGQDGSFVYYMTEKRYIESNKKRAETEERIQKGDYDIWVQACDQLFHTIRKTRYCFIWNYQYFEVDIFDSPHPGLCIMEIEVTRDQPNIILPPGIHVIKEITGDIRYSNRELARKGITLPAV